MVTHINKWATPQTPQDEGKWGVPARVTSETPEDWAKAKADVGITEEVQQPEVADKSILQSTFEKVLGAGAKALELVTTGIEYGLAPITAIGALLRDAQRDRDASEGEWSLKITPEYEPELLMINKAGEAVRAFQDKETGELLKKEGFETWFPGGRKYDEYRQLPWYEQLKWEAPVWALLAILAPSATTLRAGLAAPAKAGGVRGATAIATRGALLPIATYEQAIARLIALPGRGVVAGTKKALEVYINRNAFYIARMARMDVGSLGFKDRILYKLFNYHGHYMSMWADAALRAQRVAGQAGVKVRAATQTVQTEIALLNSGITGSTQTMNNIITATQAGKEITTTSITGLIVRGTPSEFVKGITAIITAEIAMGAKPIVSPAITGVEDTMAITEAIPTTAAAEWETVTGVVPEEGIPMPTGVQQEFLAQAETWLQQVPQVMPNSLHTIGVVGGQAFVRTDAASNVEVAGISLMREGQLTLSTIVSAQPGTVASGRALVDVGEYLKENNIAFPPREEMSPQAIRIYDKLVARGEVPEYAQTQAMAEWETVTGKPEVAATGFEGLDTTTEGVATTEVAGVPPKLPTDWDKIGGDLYDRYKNNMTPNPTPNTVPLSERMLRTRRKVEAFVADEFAGLNKLGWQAELDVAMVRAADSRSAQVYRETMKAVSKSLGNDSNLLSYTDDYLMLRHQLEVLKSTGRKYFVVRKGEKATRFTAKQIGLLFAQMKKELGATTYAKVKEAASHVPAVYNQILRGTEELTTEQIDGLIKKYPWYNPILFEGESKPIDIGHRLSPRQIKQLTTLETDTEQISPLVSLPTTIARRMKAQAINAARSSVAELAVDPANKILIGGDAEIVVKKPVGAFIDYYEKGQRKYLQLGKGAEWIARDIELLQRQPPSMTLKMVRSLQNLSKMFFTTYNPGFVAWNTAFDAVTAYFAEGITPFGFGKALAGNIKGMFTDVPGLNEFRESGGELFGFFTKGPDIGKEGAITPFISREDGQLTLRNPESLRRFINPFTFIRELGIAGENAGRRATYEKAIREGLSRKEAALRARRVTVDFSRFSRASRVINDWYIYFNPALQGFMLPGRAIKKDPRSLWRISVLIGGYVGLLLYNMSYDEYDDVRDSDKVGKLLVMLPSNEYNKYGQKVPHYLTLLPLREFAMFTAPLEYLIGRLKAEEPETYRTLAQEWDVLYPVISPLSMISEAGGLVMPTQIGATIQQLVQNHDDFRDRAIVDDEMELLPPSEQYDQYTNKMAIRVGQALGMSPKKLDFFVSNMFGALGNDLLREVNRAIEVIDREDVDERIAGLVSELRAIPTRVPPNRIEIVRETFLEGLSVEDRDLVLNMERLPDDKIPFTQSIFRRFFRDYGGQVYQTAKERALIDRTLEDYPEQALAELQKSANENANNLLNDKITKYQYDQNRTRYRAYYSGASTAQWREGMIEGAVARSDIDKYMPEAYQRSEEFQALSSYMEIRQKYTDEAGGVFDSDAWDKIEEQTLAELRSDYSETAVEYALAHKDDWIDNLPEPARTVERQRAIAIENETWWDDYRGVTTESQWPTGGTGVPSTGHVSKWP